MRTVCICCMKNDIMQVVLFLFVNTIIPTKKYFLYSASVGLGFLTFLSFDQLYHFVHESGFQAGSIVLAFLVLMCGVFVGKMLAKHLSVCTHEHTDDVDVTFIILLVIGSLVHTVFDGSVVHEAFRNGTGEGLGVVGAILLHEVVRTSILYKVIRVMGFKKSLALISVFGVSFLGIFGGYLLGDFIEQYHQYESIAHLISGGMFVAVTTDLYYYIKHHFGKVSILPVILGMITAYLIGLLGGHEE